MAIINLDGTRIKVNTSRDLDGDGKTGGIEYLNRDDGTTAIVQPTETGEALRELNDDTLDPLSRMSAIDMRSRLHWAEIGYILQMDALVALGVLQIS